MSEIVTRKPGRMSGRPCFRGTRVPLEALFDNLAAGYSLDEILDAYPTLHRAACRQALLEASALLAAAASEER